MDSGEIETSEVRLQATARGLQAPDPSLSAMITMARADNAQLCGDFPTIVKHAETANSRFKIAPKPWLAPGCWACSKSSDDTIFLMAQMGMCLIIAPCPYQF